MSRPRTYRVIFEISAFSADSAEDAARQAAGHMRDALQGRSSGMTLEVIDEDSGASTVIPVEDATA